MLPVPEAASLLAQTRAFGQFDRATLVSLAQESGVRSYRARQIVFHQGDPGDCLYVVASGLLKVFTVSEQGNEMLLATLRHPDTFGELALVDDGPRSASIETLEPTVLLSISRSAFLALSQRYPALLQAVARSVAALLRDTLERASDLVFLDLPGRVAKILLDLAHERGEPSPEGLRFRLELTQTDLAALVGGARSTVNQILHMFEQRGYIAIDGRTVLLKSAEQLLRRAGG